MTLAPDLFIAGTRRAGRGDPVHAVAPATGERIGPAFGGATAEDVADACAAAASAFRPFRAAGLERRAAFLEAIAEEIEALGDALIERAVLETALPPARILGERGRTVGQLRLFARVVFEPAGAIVALFLLRFLLGLAEAPSFPANARIVAAWFPAAERGTATAIFNSAQYFAVAVFAPLMGWITHLWGWHHVFVMMGVLGLAGAVLFRARLHAPMESPFLSVAERAPSGRREANVAAAPSPLRPKRPVG